MNIKLEVILININKLVLALRRDKNDLYDIWGEVIVPVKIILSVNYYNYLQEDFKYAFCVTPNGRGLVYGIPFEVDPDLDEEFVLSYKE